MFAKVILDNKILDLNKTFDYIIPKELEGKIHIGSRVFIPFGKGNSKRAAFVIEIVEESKYATKSIMEVLKGELLTEDQIKLARMMSRRYFCNISTCLKLMINPGYRGLKSKDLKEKTINYLALNHNKLKSLEKEEKKAEEVAQKTEKKQKKSITKKQMQLIEYFKNKESKLSKDEESDIAEEVVLEESGIGIYVINKLIEKNIVIRTEEKQELIGADLENKVLIKKDKKKNLNEEQKKVFETLKVLLDKNKYDEALLHGVTGSGKTEVYMQTIEYVLSKDKNAILLVPEIALTPQMINSFMSRFGNIIGVLHSRLTEREKFEEWLKISRGETRIVIGTRSAIFAPIKNLGIIIIDEEQDNSYKSEMNPKYTTAEVARFLCKTSNSILLLGSATPLVETYYRAVEGNIKLLEIKKRAMKTALPDVKIIDLRKSRNILSNQLISALRENKEKGKQAIIFLNKRGYSRLALCTSCGEGVKCKNCNVNMIYHKGENILKCHYCGYEKKYNAICSKCGEELKLIGIGLQQVEEMLKKEIEEISIKRLDQDAVKQEKSHNKILEAFKKEKIDILLRNTNGNKGT